MTAPIPTPAGRPAWRSVLDVIATLAIIGAAVTMMIRSAAPAPTGAAGAGRPEPALPKEALSLAGVPLLGSATAKVTVLEFSDFQCPFCGKFVRDTFPTITTKYIDTGKVQFGFRQLPLPIHNRAQRAAESAVCAAEQERFWPLHDALFAKPDALDDKGIDDAATTARLDLKAFQSCMATPPTDRVMEDVTLAKALGLSGTPAFAAGFKDASGQLVVKRFILGAQPLDNFTAVLDSLLKAD